MIGLFLFGTARYVVPMHARLRNLNALLLISFASIVAATCTAAEENGRDASTEPFDGETLQAPFSSVIVRNKDVFAASGMGLFRASLEDKRWQRLAIADRMPVAGAFGRAPQNSAHLFYHSRGINRVAPEFDLGLYHSNDSGQTWSLISKDYDFQEVYLHQDGSLYAIVVRTVKTANSTGIRWSILHALLHDGPLRWDDITGDIGCGVMLHGILDDPVHPELVRLRGSCLRAYIIHAEDKNYQWQMTHESHGGKRVDSDDAFLAPVGSALRIMYLHRATLANYFDHPFGERAEIHAWSIHTDSDSFTFARDEPKTVPVSIRFLKDSLTVRIADVRDSLDCWGMHLITPSGERIHVPPRGYRSVTRDPASKDEYRQHAQLQSTDISREQPYRRSIDLGQLADFSQPGQYRLRLSYHSDWLAEGDEWAGSFSGDIITISVR